MSKDKEQDPFAESDLVSRGDVIYHLGLRPEQLALNCILVGDPERVPFLSEKELETIEHSVEHRGLRSMMGRSRHGHSLSIITTGMGTPSTEVVITELVALNEIDLETRERKERWDPLKAIRVGTSGALQTQERTPLGTLIVSEYAVGLDNTGLFYDVPPQDDPFLAELQEVVEGAILEAGSNTSQSKGKIKPYVSKADPLLVAKLEQACEQLNLEYKKGITASSAGFFANQGRDILRVPPAVPDIDRVLASLSFTNGLKIENMEMESSFLFHLYRGLGYSAAAICVAVANRADNTFLRDSQPYVRAAGAAASLAFKH
jgi:uridine phosphorylase